jgi:hypothetical protein
MPFLPNCKVVPLWQVVRCRLGCLPPCIALCSHQSVSYRCRAVASQGGTEDASSPTGALPPLPLPAITVNETAGLLPACNCIKLWDPVCGNNGKVYANQCLAQVRPVGCIRVKLSQYDNGALLWHAVLPQLAAK